MALTIKQAVAASISNGLSAEDFHKQANAKVTLTADAIAPLLTSAEKVEELRQEFSRQLVAQMGWKLPPLPAKDDKSEKAEKAKAERHATQQNVAQYFRRWIQRPIETLYPSLADLFKAKKAGDPNRQALSDRKTWVVDFVRNLSATRDEETIDYIIKAIEHKAEVERFFAAQREARKPARKAA